MSKSRHPIAIWTALFVAIGLVAATSVKGLSASSFSPGSVAPTPQPHAFPSSQVLQQVPGPYITLADAETIALRMGQGAGGGTQVLGAKLESVSAAQAELGSRPAAQYVASDRMVWVVTLKGTYVQSSCSPAGGCLPALTNQVYYVVIDAATGHVFATGIFNAPVGH